MYQFVGDINDTKAGGLESILNYMNENFPSKGDPAINEHHCRIIKNSTVKRSRYIMFTMSIKAEHLILRVIDF